MPTTVSENDMLRFRLAAQLIRPAAGALRDVVPHFLAMQAQDFGQAVWALGARVPGATRKDVLALLDSGTVIRSWPMRGTLHFVDPADIRWMLRLTSRRTTATAAKRHRDLGLDDAAFARAAEVAASVLSGGRALGRDEMMRVWDDSGVATTGQRGVHIINHLAQNALVCWGPTHGTQQALVLLDEWAPETWVPSTEEALARFAARYFAAHGPATFRDFVWWSKLTVAEAKAGLASAAPGLLEVGFDGESYWMAPDAEAAAPARLAASMHALPGFDEYLLGYQNRSHSLAIEHAQKVVPGNSGIFLAMIVSRGRIVGVWRRSVGASSVKVVAIPFERLSASDVRGFEREAERYGRFHGLPATVEFVEADRET